MQIDRHNIDQFSKAIDNYYFVPFYTALKSSSSKYSYIKYLSLGVSVSDGFLSTIQAILGVSEALFKGVTNLTISLSNKGASAYLGVLQIFGAFWITAGSFPNILVRTISVTYKFFNDPVGFSNSQINHFLNLAKSS